MEFRQRVDELSEKYGVISGQLYDYMIWNIGLKLAIKHPIMRVFHKGEFREMEYAKTEEQLRNGYLQQNGHRLERIVNQESKNYRRT